MTRVLVLDSAAVDALASPGSHRATVRAALEAAFRLGRTVVAPSLVLAESYRDTHHTQALDALLARRPALQLRDTDRRLARLVGGVLSMAGMGSDAIVDAHVVAAAVEAGGGVCLTGDTSDLDRLAAGSSTVIVVDITHR